MTVESYVVAWLNMQPAPAPAYADVPAQRPSAFITVERTGGGGTAYADSATVAIQCWADTRMHAAALADRVRDMLLHDLPAAPPVRSVDVTGLANFPLDERTPRYQIVADIIIQF